MKKILLFVFCLAISSIIIGSKCNTYDEQSTEVSSSAAAAQGNQVTAGGVTMRWSVVGSDLSVTLSAVTSGWVAVGFKPTVGMQNANFIIGYVSGGTAVIEDNFGTSPSEHVADTIQNVTNKSGSEAGGITEISFQIPLNSGDAQDQPLAVGESCNIILAHGPADNFTSEHTSVGSVTIVIR